MRNKVLDFLALVWCLLIIVCLSDCREKLFLVILKLGKSKVYIIWSHIHPLATSSCIQTSHVQAVPHIK